MPRFEHLQHAFRDQLGGIEVKGWLAASNSTMEGGLQNTLTTDRARFI
jgi:hypothetical protein